MPSTARFISKNKKIKKGNTSILKDPLINIEMGQNYIKYLLDLKIVNNNVIYMAAAYNAGPNRVKYWKKINKNPQKKQINYVDWIELIKFKETRNYVQRVLENYNVYRYILEKKPIKMKNFFINDPLY